MKQRSRFQGWWFGALALLAGCVPDLTGTPCDAPADCDAPQVCERGFCVEPTPSDEAAAPLECVDTLDLTVDDERVHTGLLCAGAEGRVTVRLPQPEGAWRLLVRAVSHDADAGASMELLCDGEPVEPALSTTHTRIHALDAADRQVHTLWLDAGGAPLGWRAALVPATPCTGDAYEPNPEAAQAALPLESGPVTALWLCDGDVDWFHVPTADDGSTSVHLTVEGGGPVEVSLSGIDADGQMVMGTAPVEVTESTVLAWTPPDDVSVRLRVAAPAATERTFYRWSAR
ncbi:MAG: hypothetical protein H6704_07895 [Myxococcales bacterium]|nr:hypothetical protein [Myxococcales bacterium]